MTDRTLNAERLTLNVQVIHFRVEVRERVEMVGGTFSVESASGKGTVVSAQIPFRNDL